MKKLFLLFLICFSTTLNAMDTVVKEDSTPPAAEGALTSEQIPPLLMLNQPATAEPVKK